MKPKGYSFMLNIVFMVIILSLLTAVLYTTVFERVDETAGTQLSASFAIYNENSSINACINLCTYCCIENERSIKSTAGGSESAPCTGSDFEAYINRRIERDCNEKYSDADKIGKCISGSKEAIKGDTGLCSFKQCECPS